MNGWDICIGTANALEDFRVYDTCPLRMRFYRLHSVPDIFEVSRVHREYESVRTSAKEQVQFFV